MSEADRFNWVTPEAKALYEQWIELRDIEAAKFHERASRYSDPRALSEIGREMVRAMEPYNQMLAKIYTDYTRPEPIVVPR